MSAANMIDTVLTAPQLSSQYATKSGSPGGTSATLQGIAIYQQWATGNTNRSITFAGFPSSLPTNISYIFSCNVVVNFAQPTVAGDVLDFIFEETSGQATGAPIRYKFLPPVGTLGQERFTVTGIILTPSVPSSIVGSAVLSTSGVVADYTYDIYVPTITPIGRAESGDAPAIPTSLNATNITDTGFTLNWSNSVGGAAVYTATASGIVATSISSTSAVFTGLSANTTYICFVNATNAYGSVTSAPLNATTTTTPSGPPAPPANLASEDITDTSFTVTWTLVSGLTYTAVANPGAVVGTVSGNSAHWTGLTPATAYTVVVTATNSVGSTPSAGLPVSTSPAPPPPVADPQMLMLSFLIPPGTTGVKEWNISSILTPAGYIGMKSGVQQPNQALNGGDVIGYLKNAQNSGFKIMCSFGGASVSQPTSLFPDLTTAQNLADSMAYALCRKGTSNPLGWVQLSTSGGSPFAFDGIDLDLEMSGTAGGYQTECQNLLAFVKRLRAALKAGSPNGLLTMSFQSPDIYNGFPGITNGFGNGFLYSSSSAVASSYITPAGNAYALSANMDQFDYINIQYYNQGAASTGQPGGGWGPTDVGGVFPQSIGAYGYAAYIQSGGKTKIYPGLISDPNVGPGQPGGSGPPDPIIPAITIKNNPGQNIITAVTTATTQVQAAPGAGATNTNSWLSGFMSWDSPYAGDFVRTLVQATTLPTGWMLYGGQTYQGQGKTTPYPPYGAQNPGWDQNPPK